MKGIYLAAALLSLACSTTSAAVIADLQGDFTPVSFPEGWRYLASGGAIGNSSNYSPLIWDTVNLRYDVSGNAFPAPGSDYTLFAGAGIHPGPAVAQGAEFDGYVIFEYTIQPGQAGNISIVNGKLTGADPSADGNSDGWDVRFFIGDAEAGSAMIIPWSLSDVPFSQSLGYMNEGDRVYVAVGPNGLDYYDIAEIQFQLDSSDIPEPSSLSLFGAGLILVGARLRSAVRG